MTPANFLKSSWFLPKTSGFLPFPLCEGLSKDPFVWDINREMRIYPNFENSLFSAEITALYGMYWNKGASKIKCHIQHLDDLIAHRFNLIEMEEQRTNGFCNAWNAPPNTEDPIPLGYGLKCPENAPYVKALAAFVSMVVWNIYNFTLKTR